MIIKNSKRYNSAQDPVSPGLLFIQNAGAEDLQLKRERVRQIRDKAIRQISKNTTSKVLKHFLRK
jgi:hypothetical protein